MKIRGVTISKTQAGAILFSKGIKRFFILLSVLPLKGWKFTWSSFTTTALEEGCEDLISEKAFYIYIGPLFIMYTKPIL